MGSPKRRRGIGLRKWLVLALKEYAKEQGLNSHTTVVNKILCGELKPLPNYEKYKNENDEKQGVSMREELWLALKDYAKQRDKQESDTKVACKILVGMIDPIPKKSIQEGVRLAREREAAREKGLEDLPNDEAVSADDAPTAETSLDEKRQVGRPLSKGVPMDDGKSQEKKINPDDDFYGGVFNM